MQPEAISPVFLWNDARTFANIAGSRRADERCAAGPVAAWPVMMAIV